MALTITKSSNARGTLSHYLNRQVQLKAVSVSIAFDSSYPTGGEAFSFPGMNVLEHVFIEGTGTYYFVYDYANNKILAYTHADGEQVTDAADLSALTAVKALVIGY